MPISAIFAHPTLPSPFPVHLLRSLPAATLSSSPSFRLPAPRLSLRHSTKLLAFTRQPAHSSPFLPPIRSASDSHSASPTQSLSFPWIPALPSPFYVDLSQVTPLAVCKWAAVAAVAVAAVKKVAGVLMSPFFWMYFSWTWLYWPWYIAAGLAVYGLYALRKYLAGESNVFEQLAIVTSAITWLTVVPPAHVNGYLEGWPVAFFFVYHYFFFFESSVRNRLYGDLHPRPHDPKWDVKLPKVYNMSFSALIFVAHWLAAFEGPELHLVPGGWVNLGMWVLIMVMLFMRYHSVLYLHNYSEKVVVPTAVVQFGPYRWVRHPMYASTMLLFVLYFTALRAPLSSLFVVAACLFYYGRKAELEEGLLIQTFGERYEEYKSKVRYKLIPFLF